MILIIDNYDSFTYNLVQYVGELGVSRQSMLIARNDRISCEEIDSLAPHAIVISPGPCTPAEAGVSVDVVRRFAGRIPILGVCLGHQSIIAAFHGDIVRAQSVFHGKLSAIIHDGEGLFRGIPQGFEATRYHSLVADEASFPSCLTVTARTQDGVIMACRHDTHDVYGLQFHPESIMTEVGHQLLSNFLSVSPEFRRLEMASRQQVTEGYAAR